MQVAPAIIVFVVLLVFTLISWQNALRTLNAQKNKATVEQVARIEDSVIQQMRGNELLLRSGTGIFRASDQVSRTEWQEFFDQFDIKSNSDSVSSVGYAAVVPAAQKASYLASVRAEGLSDYTITPEGDREIYVPIMYSERTTSDVRAMNGFDVHTNPERRAAMESARDTGEPSMSNEVQLNNSEHQGMVVYMPVYARGTLPQTVEDRRKAIQGYVYVSIRTNDFFSQIDLGDEESFGFTVDESSTSGQKTIYASPVAAQRERLKAERVASSDMQVFGKMWRITYFANSGLVSESQNTRPTGVLSGGLAIAFITSAAVFLLLQYRTRSFALKEEYKLQKAKDELLSLASHQLRTPATGVKQYLGMVLEGFTGKLTRAQKDLLEQAYQSNERQLQIINEFLYVAKLDTGSISISEHPFDLAALVRDIVDEMKGEIKEKQHKVTVKTPKKAPIVSDEHSVRMIIENLVSNAVKYTKPDGKGRVDIVLQKEGDCYNVHVKDNGVGIAKDDMDQLFARFSRIPNELSGLVSGSGIGLFLSHQLAEQSGGRIMVESNPGDGSEFILQLPVKSVRNLTNSRENT